MCGNRETDNLEGQRAGASESVGMVMQYAMLEGEKAEETKQREQSTEGGRGRLRKPEKMRDQERPRETKRTRESKRSRERLLKLIQPKRSVASTRSVI